MALFDCLVLLLWCVVWAILWWQKTTGCRDAFPPSSPGACTKHNRPAGARKYTGIRQDKKRQMLLELLKLRRKLLLTPVRGVELRRELVIRFSSFRLLAASWGCWGRRGGSWRGRPGRRPPRAGGLQTSTLSRSGSGGGWGGWLEGMKVTLEVNIRVFHRGVSDQATTVVATKVPERATAIDEWQEWTKSRRNDWSNIDDAT